jgi:integrase
MVNRMITTEAEKMKNDGYLGIPFTESVYIELQALQKSRTSAAMHFMTRERRCMRSRSTGPSEWSSRRARISNFRFHDLRHCYCSSLRQRNVDLHAVAKLAGHQDPSMTKRYAHLNVENVREASLNWRLLQSYDGR